MKFLSSFAHDKRGATAIEYGLIVALVVLVMLAGLTLLGNKSTSQIEYVKEQVDSAL